MKTEKTEEFLTAGDKFQKELLQLTLKYLEQGLCERLLIANVEIVAYKLIELLKYREKEELKNEQ